MNLPQKPTIANDPASADSPSVDAGLADDLRNTLRENILEITDWNLSGSYNFASDTHCILRFPLSQYKWSKHLVHGIFARSLALISERVQDTTIDPRLRFLRILEIDLVRFAQTGDLGKDRVFHCCTSSDTVVNAIAFRWDGAITNNCIPRHDRLDEQLIVRNRARMPQDVSARDLGFRDERVHDFDNTYRVRLLTNLWRKIIPSEEQSLQEKMIAKNMLPDQTIRLEDMGYALECIHDRLCLTPDQFIAQWGKKR